MSARHNAGGSPFRAEAAGTLEAWQPEAAEGYRYFHRFHRALAINLTLTCPLTCAHCFIDSGPRRREAIDHRMIVRRVEEIAAEGRIRLLVISGGEPFLARATLAAVLAVAKAGGLQVAVSTSAHFAATLARARRFLEGFPGITHLCVSADRYHTPFVPLDQVRHALTAAAELGIHPVLMIRVWDLERDAFLEEARTVVGDALLRRISIDLGPLQLMGRGHELGVMPPAASPDPEDWAGHACDSANQPVVDHDGTVLACCNYEAARETEALQLGSLLRQTMAEVTRSADGDGVLQAIRTWGPKRLVELLEKRGYGERLERRYPPDSICALCRGVTGNSELVAALRSILAEPELANDLILSRMLRYGEVWPGLAPGLEPVREPGRPVAAARAG